MYFHILRTKPRWLIWKKFSHRNSSLSCVSVSNESHQSAYTINTWTQTRQHIVRVNASLTTAKVPWTNSAWTNSACEPTRLARSNLTLSLFFNTHTFPAHFLFRSLLIVWEIECWLTSYFYTETQTSHHFLCAVDEGSPCGEELWPRDLSLQSPSSLLRTAALVIKR